ncbi:MAG TPA: hypothetical protein PKA05_01935 [Roseiflexaceae bacterium]|nr:hypothetical protein [Roseiflexaceae bacterium]HMP39115.1 hypothetical protein [Roseiflexaceae bacterium]
MARPKRQQPMLAIVRAYLQEHLPELQDAPLRLRMLDGPPGSPRYTVTIEKCRPGACPHNIPSDIAAAGACPVRSCAQRTSIRLLLDLKGEVVSVIRSDLHWS